LLVIQKRVVEQLQSEQNVVRRGEPSVVLIARNKVGNNEEKLPTAVLNVLIDALQKVFPLDLVVRCAEAVANG
jgi:hypothetical protein